MAMFSMPDYTYALYYAMYSIFSLLALLLVRMQLYSSACLVHACAVSLLTLLLVSLVIGSWLYVYLYLPSLATVAYIHTVYL